MFIIGGAGAGKSALLRHVIQEYTKLLHRDSGKLAVTASTGAAALQTGGSTLHLFAGIGLGVGSLMECAATAGYNRRVQKRWVDAQVLIIDEISMVSPVYMSKVDTAAKTCRGSPLPMGGLKVILCGDFLQLPPVDRQSSTDRLYTGSWWTSMKIQPIRLCQCIRKIDADFALGLSEMRMGRVPEDLLISTLEGRTPQLCSTNFEGATRLRFLKAQVAECNTSALTFLNNRPSTVYKAQDIGNNSSGALSRSCPLPPVIELKVGALVMLTRNLSRELVNGSMGRVVQFAEQENCDKSLPVVALEQPNGHLL